MSSNEDQDRREALHWHGAFPCDNTACPEATRLTEFDL
jgi:hypothetical protein